MQEIERKFLVGSDVFKQAAFKKYRIKQGYLNSDPERTIRVRIKDDRAFLTIKGISDESGTTRFEWEKEIPADEGESLIDLCEPGIIEKERYEVNVGGHVFEVDEFFGENEGLVLAEIELKTAEEDFEKPQWLGREVTGDLRYYNSRLSKVPFKNWKK